MYDKLTAKKRAINNWQRLRIVLLLLQVCGGRTTEAKKQVQMGSKVKKKPTERIAKYIIDPKDKWKIIWDIIVGIFYLITLVTDPVVLSFHFKHLQYLWFYDF